MTKAESVKLQCTCGHIMGTRKATNLNQMKEITAWECSKCGKRYTTTIIIRRIE